MGRLRERQAQLRREGSRRRGRLTDLAILGDAASAMFYAPAASHYQESIRARWRGGPTVLAFLFAHPDSAAIETLDARGEYFDHRTGLAWDLFFPGYYKSSEPTFEVQTGARAVGHGFAESWFFSPSDFNLFRDHVERASEGGWTYSGGSDLVLVNGWMPETGEPTIDWPSTQSGALSDADGTRTLTVAEIIERVTRDLETGAEDAAYGVGEVVAPGNQAQSHVARDVIVGALGGIAAALGKSGLGL